MANLDRLSATQYNNFMKIRSGFALIVACAVVCAVALVFRAFAQTSPAPSPQAAREEAYRANNLGVALLEQFKYTEAAEMFRRALKADPALAIARVNLGIALYNAPDLAGALRELKAASAALPRSPQPHYMLGLIAKSESRVEDAIAAFRRVLEIDPADAGANINYGQLQLQQRKYPEAIALFRAALAAEPYNVTATYNLAIALTRGGQREEGQTMMQRFQALREAGYGTTIGQNYLEQGRYAEALSSTGAEPGLVDGSVPEVSFVDAPSSIVSGDATKADAAPNPGTSTPGTLTPALGRTFKAGELTDPAKRDLASSFSGNVTLFDFDGDGDLDLFEVTPSAQKLFRNDGGKYADVTGGSGLALAKAEAIGINAVAGDYDNDTRPDLFVLRYGASALYHNDGDGKFSDVTSAARIPAYAYLAVSSAFVDVDHDGDLDIFVAGLADLSKPKSGDAVFPLDFAPAPNRLLRNNGDGKFTDTTDAAKVAGAGHSVAVVPSDYDNRRDVDLLIVSYGGAPVLFSNLRDGTFRDVAPDVGLSMKGRFTSVAAGDFNKDDYTDFFFGRDDGPGLLATSDGRTRFVTAPAPSGTEAAASAQFLDYDNDGLLDLVLLSQQGARVLRNLGTKWDNVSARAAPSALWQSTLASSPSPRAFASGDIDGDGDTDVVASFSRGGTRVARNDGGNRNQSVRVRLEGKVSNRSGVGAKLEARAGSLKQKLETYSASPAPAPSGVVFGIGRRAGVDAVRVLWPAGIVQAETEVASAKPGEAQAARGLTVTEVDRKPSSCPYLYAWNGERFEFITDFMGGGEMGYWLAPGVRNIPDPDEYVRIPGDRLRPRDGRYELRVTNELEEALYLDRLQLVAVAHPADTEVYPNEGMIDPPRPPFKLYSTRGARPPVSASDDQGRDVLAELLRMDRKYPDGFRLLRIRGYAEMHDLTLDLGEPSKAKGGRTVLLLTAWTDYAFSSDNVAAHQAGLSLSPPALQVKDAKGEWRTVIQDIGIPVGRPQTVAVDLTGKFLSRSREVRIRTNMRIYWDQALVDTSEGDAPVEMARLEAVRADLRWRGFSAEVTPDGREPFGYDYDRVSPTSPWKVMAGRYTREGDVRELVSETDDIFIISRPGDEVALSFDAAGLPPLPSGWKRTFLLYADGFSKEMDINSASPDQVLPLPFHGMTGYPYPPPEAYPMTPKRRAYLERYNTRVVTSTVPPIETTFADQTASPGPAAATRRKGLR
ncbi:MAG TPA: FG-GAP-like repeat-containing protein [Blastocatellia bacterium]|nr:FG-GAP-like repeat-containing protein [Blastocatellia bacterium]